MTFLSKSNTKNFYIFSIALIIISVLGFFIRVQGLGVWPLALDEYFIIKSTENILKLGIPEFSNGGFYIRGLLYQYMIAPLMEFGVKAEFAGRIIPLLFNLLALPALYLILKKYSNSKAIIITFVLFAFSIWEVEFARFARMYAPFQTVFIWYIYFFIKRIIDQDKNAEKWMIVLCVLSVFIYEASIFLMALNFVPLFWDNKSVEFHFKLNKKNIPIGYILFASLLLFSTVVFYSYDFRTLNSNEFFSKEMIELYKGVGNSLENSKIRIPNILLFFIDWNYLSIIGLFLIMIVNFYIIKIIVTHDSLEYKTKLIYGILLILAFLNQLGLVFLLLILSVLTNIITLKHIKDNVILKISVAISLNLLFWYLFCLLTNNWHSIYSSYNETSLIGETRKIFKLFLEYPYNYEMALLFFKTMPKFFIMSFFVLLFQFVLILVKPKEDNGIRRLLMLLFFLLLFLVTIINTHLFDTRYFFFLYPIILVLWAISISDISVLICRIINKNNFIESLISTGILILALVISEDFNISHLTNVDNLKYNYRIGLKKDFADHLYLREDIKTPAEYIIKNRNEDDIIITNEIHIDYYLPEITYQYQDIHYPKILHYSTKKGKYERWSGSNLITTSAEVDSILTNTNSTVWFVDHKKKWLRKQLEQINFYERFTSNLVYTNLDNTISVYKIH